MLVGFLICFSVVQAWWCRGAGRPRPSSRHASSGADPREGGRHSWSVQLLQRVGLQQLTTISVLVGVVSAHVFSYPKAISLLTSRRFASPLRMITHRFELTQLHEALDLISRAPEGVVKVMVNCDI